MRHIAEGFLPAVMDAARELGHGGSRMRPGAQQKKDPGEESHVLM
jgi:hypothetical protein